MKKTKLMMLAAATLGLAACSSDENGVDTTNERVAVEFSGSVGAVQTRAVDQAWSTTDQIGIFMKKTGEALNSANIMEGASNICYKYDTESYFNPSTTTIYYPMNGAQVDFVAYYPYSTSKAKIDNDGATYDISVADQSDQEAIDFMYSNNVTGKSKADKDVALSFDHKLCKVVLTVQNGEGVNEGDLTGLTVKVKSQSTTATFDLATGEIKNDGTQSDITFYKQANSYVYEAILLPNTDASRVFEFCLDNSTDSPFTWDMNKALVSGNKYTYTVKLNRSGVAVSGSINPWTSNVDNTVHDATMQ